MKKKILLLSPYDTLSHQYWRLNLVKQFPDYEWTVLTLEPRYYPWRIRGNSFAWAHEQKTVLERPYDLLIACSLTDLSSLRGFIPSLGKIPTLLYCHENQFYYPRSEHQQGNVEQQMIQIYNFECADAIVFNSQFNMHSCFEGITQLFKKLPDHVPHKALEQFQLKSTVLPIPLSCETVLLNHTNNVIPEIVWNHRWEYDKGLQQLECFVDQIIVNKLSCKFHLIGQQFRQIPDSLKSILSKLEQHSLLGHSGFIKNKNDYFDLLAKSDFVLSTSLHEFQGLAIMEAVMSGCIPVLPNALSYPEFFDNAFLYERCLLEPEREAMNAFQKLNALIEMKQAKEQLPDLAQTSIPLWKDKKNAYQNVFRTLAGI